MGGRKGTRKVWNLSSVFLHLLTVVPPPPPLPPSLQLPSLSPRFDAHGHLIAKKGLSELDDPAKLPFFKMEEKKTAHKEQHHGHHHH